MKLKKRIKQLESELKGLKLIVKKSSITLYDEIDPTMRIEIALNNGVFTIHKIKTSTTENSELIFKDNQ